MMGVAQVSFQLTRRSNDATKYLFHRLKPISVINQRVDSWLHGYFLLELNQSLRLTLPRGHDLNKKPLNNTYAAVPPSITDRYLVDARVETCECLRVPCKVHQQCTSEGMALYCLSVFMLTHQIDFPRGIYTSYIYSIYTYTVRQLSGSIFQSSSASCVERKPTKKSNSQISKRLTVAAVAKNVCWHILGRIIFALKAWW